VEEIAGGRWVVYDNQEDCIVGKWQRSKEEAEKRKLEILSRHTTGLQELL
jgi:hypothetical protein